EEWFARSQAPPGNAVSCRLRLHSEWRGRASRVVRSQAEPGNESNGFVSDFGFRASDFTRSESKGTRIALGSSSHPFSPHRNDRRGLIKAAIGNVYAVIVLALLIAVLGAVAIASIPVDILPVFKTPAVQVLTYYNGMPAGSIEKTITNRLER